MVVAKFRGLNLPFSSRNNCGFQSLTRLIKAKVMVVFLN